MKKHKWEKVWEEKSFEITTLTPSILVSKYATLLEPGNRVLDIGCGNGRNSIFLACKGCVVDCFDIADLHWIEKLDNGLQEKINFKKSTVLNYSFKSSQYKVIILARVIQYLSLKELFFLFDKIKDGIHSDGFLLLSFNTKGGIFNRKEIDVSTHSYSINQIEKMLKDIFRNVVVTEGSTVNMHVNYQDTITTFDIYASNPY